MATKKEQLTAAGKAVGAAKKALKGKPDDEQLKKALVDAEAKLANLKEKPKPKEEPKPKKAKALRITCVVDGFWRAGRQWSKQPITVPLDDLNNKELKLITGEAKLAVEHVDIDVPADQ